MNRNVLAICNAYEQVYAKGLDMKSCKNPYKASTESYEAWGYGYKEGRTALMKAFMLNGMQEEGANQHPSDTPPNVGEWWMCKSKQTYRTTPMVKTCGGWCAMVDTDGMPIKTFTTVVDDLIPIFKMCAVD